jgi:hypothetical protein
LKLSTLMMFSTSRWTPTAAPHVSEKHDRDGEMSTRAHRLGQLARTLAAGTPSSGCATQWHAGLLTAIPNLHRGDGVAQQDSCERMPRFENDVSASTMEAQQQISFQADLFGLVDSSEDAQPVKRLRPDPRTACETTASGASSQATPHGHTSRAAPALGNGAHERFEAAKLPIRSPRARALPRPPAAPGRSAGPPQSDPSQCTPSGVNVGSPTQEHTAPAQGSSCETDIAAEYASEASDDTAQERWRCRGDAPWAWPQLRKIFTSFQQRADHDAQAHVVTRAWQLLDLCGPQPSAKTWLHATQSLRRLCAGRTSGTVHRVSNEVVLDGVCARCIDCSSLGQIRCTSGTPALDMIVILCGACPSGLATTEDVALP